MAMPCVEPVRTDALFDQAVVDELAVSVNDGAAVDAEAFGKRPFGREASRLREGTRQDRLAQMLVDLAIERNDRVTVELRENSGPSNPGHRMMPFRCPAGERSRPVRNVRHEHFDSTAG